jgi:hypothetical protein
MEKKARGGENLRLVIEEEEIKFECESKGNAQVKYSFPVSKKNLLSKNKIIAWEVNVQNNTRDQS